MGTFLKAGNYYIDYYANGRRWREKVGKSRKLAETVLAKRKVQVAEGKFLDIKRNPKIKFPDNFAVFASFPGPQETGSGVSGQG